MPLDPLKRGSSHLGLITTRSVRLCSHYSSNHLNAQIKLHSQVLLVACSGSRKSLSVIVRRQRHYYPNTVPSCSLNILLGVWGRRGFSFSRAPAKVNPQHNTHAHTHTTVRDLHLNRVPLPFISRVSPSLPNSSLRGDGRNTF